MAVGEINGRIRSLWNPTNFTSAFLLTNQQQWDLATVTVAYGGTGVTSWTTGQLLAASSSSTIAGINAVPTGQVLISQGTSTLPQWSTNVTISTLHLTTNLGLFLRDVGGSHYLNVVSGSTLTADRKLTLTGGDADRAITLRGDLSTGNNVSFVGNFASTITFSGITSVTMPVSGTVTATSGSSYNVGDILYASSSSIFSTIAAVATGQVLASAGITTSPVWSSAPSLASLTLTNNTNQLALGTTNVTTYTMASLTGNRTFTTPDANSNSVVPSSASAHNFATAISSGGVISYAQPAFSDISGTATTAQFPAGTVLQTQSVTKVNTFNTTTTLASGGVAVTGLSITITPRNSNSQFLLFASLTVGTSSTFGFVGSWFARGSTALGTGTPASTRLGVMTRTYFNNVNVNTSQSMNYLDSPATGSAVTYNIYICNESAGVTTYLNQTPADTDNNSFGARSSSTLTVLEIAG